MSGFLSRLLATDGPPAPPGPLDDFWWTAQLGTQTQSGERITPEIALLVSTVFACLKVLSETIASLPLIVYERVSDREKQRAYGTPEYQLLHRTPNAWQTPYDFKENLTVWAALYGKGCAFKIVGRDGYVAELDPIHPSKIKVEKLPTRQLRYQVLQQDGTWKPYVQGEIFHLRGFSIDGIDGMNLSIQAREAIGLARAMEAFGSRYFANDATIGAVLEHPGKLSPEAHKRLQQDLRGFTGGNQFKGKVLEEGMKVSRIQTNAREAQLTDARLHQVIEICRFFRMPPHKVAHLLQATFSNIEHQGIEFATDTIQPWCVRWEEALTRDVILDDERYFAEFLMSALLRGDSAARSQYYRERFHIGTLSRNEIRALENENPIPGGDTYYVNAAVVPLGDDGRPIPAKPIPAPSAAPPSTTGAGDDSVTEEAAAATRGSFSAWCDDVADRLASAEAREIGQRADKRGEDPARFRSWARAWYGGSHREYVRRAIAPFADAYARATNATPDVDRLAALVVDQGFLAAEAAAPFIAAEFHALRRRAIVAAVTTECLLLDPLEGDVAHA